MADTSKAVLEEVLDLLREGVYITDVNRVITYWNQGAERITGFKEGQIIGTPCQLNLLEHIEDSGNSLCEDACPLERAIKHGESFETEAHIHHKEGHRVPVFIRTSPIRDDNGQIIGACEVFGDISSRIATNKKLHELEKIAMLDHLTQLANRRYMELELAVKLENSKQTGAGVGVLFYDIDHFKAVNDTYGHDVGDDILRMVAKTLQKTARSLDILGRWGGEEFVEIVPNTSSDLLYVIAERNRVLVERSKYNRDTQPVQTTVSIGATLIQREDTMDSLLRRADQLMYQSKEAGRNRVTLG
ncbi:MAG: GGDEF domain-containing protein [Magnetococcales bacterium]|nr:GGDEF domain-containing protein [Magnetococcales bacterium]